MHELQIRIVVLGLGYVGCPLAYELAKHFDTVGFDIDVSRVDELRLGIDRTNELTAEQLALAQWELTTLEGVLAHADVLIVTVPTPITGANVPDLTPVRKATEMIARHLKAGQTVVYESTVYPGVTEEVCIPLLETSGLSWVDADFHVAYSPERINPGDKVNTLTTVTKVVSGDCSETLDLVDAIYSKITKTHRAPTIKVAEAAKVIENTQRDVNIGLMNELSNIFGRLEIDTYDVLEAAGTKWNFLKFTPGLVGGHCISVDPYYLTHRAQEAGYIPSLILSAREVNDQAPALIAYRTLQAMSKAGISNSTARVLVLGCTFKENVPDIRNSKVFNLINELQDWGIDVWILDPLADRDEVLLEHGIDIDRPLGLQYDVIILAVPHAQFYSAGWVLIDELISDGPAVVADLKGILDRAAKPPNVTLIRQ